MTLLTTYRIAWAPAALACVAAGLLLTPRSVDRGSTGRADPLALLSDDDPVRRVAGCEALGDEADAAVLIARASDSDWRVRSAAFAALDRLAPLGQPIPPRDTPMAEREKVILRWLDHRADLRGKLCEIYADLRHVELSHTMVRECFTCHAPDPPPESADSASCVRCHADVSAEYGASSHAQSLSHLRLTTVDPRTRKVELYDFSPRQGIGCAACHAPVGHREAPLGGCAYAFQKPADSTSCLTCHAEIGKEHDLWLNTPQFQRADWPPGQIAHAREPLTRSCTDCHMAADEDGHAAPAHRLTARRDPVLLRSGLDLQLRPPVTLGGVRVVPIVLTNLAGHDNPTGTRRRGMEITARFEPGGEPISVAFFSPVTLPGTDNAPALKPNEQRTFHVAIPPDARSLTCTAAYIRHRFDPEHPTYEVLTRTLFNLLR